MLVASIVAGVLCSAGAALAQDSRTIALARELTTLLEQQKLDAVAARQAGSADRFVAALYFPGSQLLVVSATYAAPPLLNEKILLRRYKEAYMDLSAASDPTTVAAKRVFGIGDAFLLEQRAAALAEEAGVPPAALDLALFNFGQAEPARATMGSRAEPDDALTSGIEATLGV